MTSTLAAGPRPASPLIPDNAGKVHEEQRRFSRDGIGPLFLCRQSNQGSGGTDLAANVFKKYIDGRPNASKRMIVRDEGIVLWHGDGPDSCDIYGAREAIAFEYNGVYFEPRNGTWFLFTNHIGLDEKRVEYTDAIWVYWSKNLNRWDVHDKAIVLDPQNCT